MPVDRRSGFSLLEVTVVLVMLGVLATMAVPRVTAQAERLRMDRAVAELHGLWKAERRFRLLTGVWAPDVDTLVATGLLRRPAADSPWEVQVAAARGDRLTLRARRRGGSTWHGALTLDETGTVSGLVTDGQDRLRP